MSNTWSVCPVVRRERMKLFEHVTVGGETRLLPFEREIIWLRESETRIVLRHDDVEFKDLATLSDFHGFLTSLDIAITDDAAVWIQKFKIGVGDRLSVDLDVKICDYPVLEDKSNDAKEEAQRFKGKKYRKSYVETNSENGRHWFTSDKPVSDEKYSRYPILEARAVAEAKAIFSSRKHSVESVPPEISAWIGEQRKTAEAMERGIKEAA